MTAKLAIIGGTGLDSLPGLEIVKRETVQTPYGDPSAPVLHGRYADKNVIFLARHGERHTLPPHRLNYRANIYALKQAGAEQILAVAAVGGITPAMRPGCLAIPDQIIDYTWGRAHTFFDQAVDAVTHIDFTNPYDADLREELISAAQAAGVDFVPRGTYGTAQGPRLESAAEIRRMERDGCDMVGMTGMPEAALARELALPYVCCAVVVNWAAGKGPASIHDEIDKYMERGVAAVRQLLNALLKAP